MYNLVVRAHYDAVVVGGGHNGLTAAAYLARAGWSVLVLERAETFGGATASASPFPGVDVALSRYSYLVSLLPAKVVSDLGLAFTAAPRRIASCAPRGEAGLLIASDDRERTRETFARTTGSTADHDAWERFGAMTAGVARAIFPTLTEPLLAREEARRLVGDDGAWRALVEEPIGAVIERTFDDDLVRGAVLTDALIGTFAGAHDPSLRQNRCFLYHVIGGGTGEWRVPVGGMGALARELERAARRAGAELRAGCEATAVGVADGGVEVEFAGPDGSGARVGARHLLVAAGPSVLAGLLGDPDPGTADGCQLKVNLVLERLPVLRDPSISPQEAFAGTFRAGEGFAELARAHADASQGRMPERPPCEVYCHTLSDPSILSDELRERGWHTLTCFALHLPAALFRADPQGARREALARTLAVLDGVLAEPLEACIARDADGAPCVEASSPVDLERTLAMAGGNIFHGDLQWPWAEREEQAGTWGVETAHPRVWLCGAGARRGGGVSCVPGHNVARALLGQAPPRRAPRSPE